MTILHEDFISISMQHSGKTRNVIVQECVGRTDETSHTKSLYDMTSGSSDENIKGKSTRSSIATNIVTSVGAYTGSSSSGKPSNCTSTTTTTSSSSSSSQTKAKVMSKKVGKRPGRKPAKIDERAKLERSRQSAKECRARKKLRYQYLEELVLNREKAVLALRDELELFKQWCIQMDAGGKIPDPLLKMIANEDVSRQAHQVQQVKRATQLQQQHENQHLTFDSSGASTSSSLTSMHQSQTGDVSPSRIPNLSPTRPDRHYSGPHLKRQLAFDFDNMAEFSSMPSKHQYPYQSKLQPQHQTAMSSSSSSSSFNMSKPIATSTDSQPQYMYQQQTSKSGGASYQATPRAALQPPRSFGLQFQNAQNQQYQNQAHVRLNQAAPEAKFSFMSRHNPPVSRIQSEPPMKYMQALDSISEYQPPRYSSANNMKTGASGSYSFGNVSLPGPTISQGSSISTAISRVRSNSNPAFMSKKVPQQVSPTEGGRRVDEIVSSLHARDSGLVGAGVNKPKSFSLPNTLYPTSSSGESNNLGLFSGRPLPIAPSVSSMVVDDHSDSSEENSTEMPLFQSSYGQAQKRALSDPDIHKHSQEVPVCISSMVDSDMVAVDQDYLFQKSNMDPQAKLSNLTTVHCLSSTNTLNTPSHSPFMMVPRNTDSPLSSSPAPSSTMGYPNTTPSSSNTPSPAPLTSFTPLLELSTGSSVEESAMDVTNVSTKGITAITPGAANQAGTSSVVCSETGLSATIAEPIPEWYSFLADLEDGGLIPKQVQPERAVTPVNKFMNVPNFLDEILGDDNDD